MTRLPAAGLSLAGALLIAASPAHAFPVVEGTGALSSLLGALSAMVAGSATASNRATRQPGLRRAGLLLLAGITVVAVLVAAQAHLAAREDIHAARQSRPQLNLPDAVAARTAITQTPAPEAIPAAIAEGLFVAADDFYAGDFADHRRVYINADSHAQRHQPTAATSLLLAPTDLDALKRQTDRHDGRLLLMSEDLGHLARLGLSLDPSPRLLWLGDPELSTGAEVPLSRRVPRDADVDTLPLVDIRGPRVLRETHTLHNAISRPLGDLVVMTDVELATWLDRTRPVFTAYDEALYPQLAGRLARLGPDPPWSVLSGGLEAQFFPPGLPFMTQGRGIAPDYPTKRLLDPDRIEALYAATDKLRFLCTTPSVCPDNLPRAERVMIDFTGQSRAARMAALAELPRDALYVAVSGSQESAGNALLAGWWLTRTGHAYLGELPLPRRFSLEEIRARASADGATSLAPYRDPGRSAVRLRAALSHAIDTLGWAWAMLVTGALVRAALLPAQWPAVRALYDGAAPPGAAMIGSLAVLAGMVAAYLWLDRTLSDFALIRFDLYAQPLRAALFGMPPDAGAAPPDAGAFEAARTSLAAVLATALIAQVALSFPTRPRHLALVAGLVAALWAGGLLSAIPAPMALFLLGSEAAVLLFQAPLAARFLARARLRRHGLHAGLPATGANDLPGKVALTCRAGPPQPGLVAELAGRDRADLDALARRALRTDPALARSERLIVRSADMDGVESRRGGWHASPIVPPTPAALAQALTDQAAAGLDHAWIQPLRVAEAVGTLVSIDTDGTRGRARLDAPGTPTGSGDTLDLDTRTARRHHHRLWRLLRRAERRLGGPVHLEVSMTGGRPALHQARRMDPIVSPEARIWPHGRRDLALAADLVAAPNRLTGEVLAHATGGAAIYLRGFLYWHRARLPRKLRPPWRNPSLTRLEERVHTLCLRAGHTDSPATGTRNTPEWARPAVPTCLAAATSPGGCVPVTPTDPTVAECQAIVRDALDVMTTLWALTQARGAPSTVPARLAIHTCENCTTGPELDAALAPARHATMLSQSATRDRRTYLHDLLCVCLSVFAGSAARLIPEACARAGAGLADILGTPFAPGRDIRDAAPMTAPEPDIIVPGPIRGHPWDADRAMGPPDHPEKHILIGVEIGPQWARHLERFAGLVACYGHPQSHVGLTAAATATPFRRVASTELPRLKALNHMDV